MSSSGLIYAVIVGAWAAYLVPMWLRRQDELNESRPTERFSTAIRLLAGRSAMERRAARALGDQTADNDESEPAEGGSAIDAHPDAGRSDRPAPEGDASRPGTAGEPAGAFDAGPADAADRFEAVGSPDAADPAGPARPEAVRGADAGRRDGSPRNAAHRDAGHRESTRHSAERRARLLARRRRMVTLLFAAFALGAVVAAVAGVAFIWVPALPAVLLTLYIGHLRRLERQRYEVKLDRVRAAQAAERLHDRERARGARRPVPHQGAHHEHDAHRDHDAVGIETVAHTPYEGSYDAAHPGEGGRPNLRLAADPGEHAESAATAVVEATEHEEWVDGMRERSAAGPDSWEPVPVPLPTYVTAPVAPRVSRGLDLGSPGTWDSGRPAEPATGRNTPLFDQYADPAAGPAVDDYATRPRAANE